MVWAAGYAVPSHDQMAKIRAAALGAVIGVRRAGTSRLLQWTCVACHWDDPVFVADWRTLRILFATIKERCFATPWKAGIPAEFTTGSPTRRSVRLREVLAKYGWEWDDTNGVICGRAQVAPQPLMRIGWDGPQVVERFMVTAWQTALVLKEGRVWKSLHRKADPALAQGLDLPAPQREGGLVPTLGAHRHLASIAWHTHEPGDHLLAVAAGLNVWQTPLAVRGAGETKGSVNGGRLNACAVRLSLRCHA